MDKDIIVAEDEDVKIILEKATKILFERIY